MVFFGNVVEFIGIFLDYCFLFELVVVVFFEFEC